MVIAKYDNNYFRRQNRITSLPVCLTAPPRVFLSQYNVQYYSLGDAVLLSIPAIPAEFTQPLQSMEVKEGEDVTLSCEFSLPGVAFHWKRGLETLRAGERYLMKQKRSFISLTITGPKPQDSGDYTCQCRDHRTTASLTVHGKSHPCFSFQFPGCIIWSKKKL